MLGWRSRRPFLSAEEDERLLPGSGIVRAVVLVDGRVVGTWKLDGSGRRRRVLIDRFGDEPPADALAAEVSAVGAFLELELELAS